MEHVVITHDGEFHADDVFGVAALQLYLGIENTRIIRTRDEHIIASGDWVLDVGGIYNPNEQRFDHHQNGAPIRTNGIPYAAFGLVWKHIGKQLAGSTEVADVLEQQLVTPIDASDNGIPLFTPVHEPIVPFELFHVISLFLPEWNTPADFDTQFVEATHFAREVITRSITHAKAHLAMSALIQRVYETSANKHILEFEIPMQSNAFIDYPEVAVAVYPQHLTPHSNWVAVTIRKNKNSFDPRVQFPLTWAGLREEELVRASGIADAVFAHKARFYFVAQSRESALLAAAQAA